MHFITNPYTFVEISPNKFPFSIFGDILGLCDSST